MTFSPNDSANYVDQTNKPLIGVVVDNNDPLKLRRVKCKVQGLIETDNDEALPWFRPKTTGAGSRADYGNFDEIPEINTTVEIAIPDGDVNNGVYSAMPDTSVDASQIRLFGGDYPNTYGTCDSSGTFTRTNKKKGFTEKLHKSGFYTKTDKDGNLHIHIPGNVYLHIKGNMAIQVDKNLFVKVLEMLGLASDKNAGISSSQNLELLAGSNAAVTAGGNTDINGGVTFGVKDAVEATVPDAIKEKDKDHAKIKEEQKIALKSGELANSTISDYKKALQGTRQA